MKRFWERPLPAEVPRIELRQYTGCTVFDSWKSSFFFSFLFVLFSLYFFSYNYFLYPNGFFPLIFPRASRGYGIRVFLVKFCCSKPCMSEKKKTRTISTDFNSLKWQVKPNIRSSFKQFGKPYQGMTSLYSMLHIF